MGRRVGVAGGSGGSSVLAADECEEAGLDVIPLPEEIRQELKNRGNQVWDWIGNPADMSIRIDRDFDTGGMLEIMASKQDFDLLIGFVRGPHHRGDTRISADEVLKRYRISEINKPLIAVIPDRNRGIDDDPEYAWMQELMEEVKARLIDASIPIYQTLL